MGYYSDYRGEYTPVREITLGDANEIQQWFVDRFGKYSVDDNGRFTYEYKDDNGERHWYSGDIVFDYDEWRVVPRSENMKGYNFNEHLYEFVEWLKKNIPDVEFEGDVERIGEEFGDMECIRIESGVVKSYCGRIAWENPIICNKTQEQSDTEIRARVGAMFGGVK